MPRDNGCMYMAHVCFYVCCVAAVVKKSVLALECMLCVCVGDVMDVVFSVCIVRAWSSMCSCMGSADVVCLCLVCILWQFSMLRSA